jgi:TP901 family phage tail tape measure protein
MAKDVVNLTVKTNINSILDDFNKLNKKLDDVNKKGIKLDKTLSGLGNVKLTGIDKQIDSLTKSLDKADIISDELYKSLNKINKTTLRDTTKNLNKGMETLTKTTKEADKSYDKMSSNKALEDKTRKATQGTNSYNNSLMSSNKITKAATKPMRMLESQYSKTGTTMLAMAATTYQSNAIIADSVSLYSELDSTVREMTYQFSQNGDSIITNTMSYSEFNRTGSETKQIMDELSDIAGVTAFNTQDTTNAMLELAKAGYTSEDSLGVLSSAMIAADMNGLDLDTTIHSTVGTLNAFGISIKDAENPTLLYGNALSSMQIAADMTNSSLEDVTKGMEYMAPIASNVGLSFEESAVMLAMLGDAGLEAEKGARVLASGLLNLTNPTNAAQASLDDLGVSIYDSSGTMIDMQYILADLSVGLADCTEEEKAFHLETIFGKTAIKSWGSLINLGSDSLIDISKSLVNTGDHMDYLNSKFLETTMGVPTQEIDNFNQELVTLQDDMVGFNYTIDASGKYFNEQGKEITDSTNLTKIYAYEVEQASRTNDLMNESFIHLAETNPSKYFELLGEQMIDFQTQVGGVITEMSAVPVSIFIDELVEGTETLKTGLDELFPSLDLSSISTEEFGAQLAATSLVMLSTVGVLSILVYNVAVFASGFAALSILLGGFIGFKSVEDQMLSLDEAINKYIIPSIEFLDDAFSKVLIPTLGDFLLSTEEVMENLSGVGSSMDDLLDSTSNVDSLNNIFINLNDTMVDLSEISSEVASTFIDDYGDDVIGIMEDLSIVISELAPFILDSFGVMFEILSMILPVVEVVTNSVAGLLENISDEGWEVFAKISGTIMATWAGYTVFNKTSKSVKELSKSMSTLTTSVSVAGKGFSVFGLGAVASTGAVVAGVGAAIVTVWALVEALDQANLHLRDDVISETEGAIISLENAHDNMLISEEDYKEQSVKLAQERTEEIRKWNDDLLDDGQMSQEQYNDNMKTLDEEYTSSLSENYDKRSDELDKMLLNNEINSEEYQQKQLMYEENLTETQQSEYDVRATNLEKMLTDGIINTDEYMNEISKMNMVQSEEEAIIAQRKADSLKLMLDSGEIQQQEYNDKMLILGNIDYENWKVNYDKKEADLKTQYEGGAVSAEEYYDKLEELQSTENSNFETYREDRKNSLTTSKDDNIISEETYHEEIRELEENTVSFYDEQYDEDLINLEQRHADGLIAESTYQTDKRKLEEGHVAKSLELEESRYQAELSLAEGNSEELLRINADHETNLQAIKIEGYNNELAIYDEKEKNGISLTEAEKIRVSELEGLKREEERLTVDQQLWSQQDLLNSVGEINSDMLINHYTMEEAKREESEKTREKLIDESQLTYDEQLQIRALANSQEYADHYLLLEEKKKLSKDALESGKLNQEEYDEITKFYNSEQSNDARNLAYRLVDTQSVTKDQLIAYDEEYHTNFVKNVESRGIRFDKETGKMVDSHGESIAIMNKRDVKDLLLDIQTYQATGKHSEAVNNMNNKQLKEKELSVDTEEADNSMWSWFNIWDGKSIKVKTEAESPTYGPPSPSSNAMSYGYEPPSSYGYGSDAPAGSSYYHNSTTDSRTYHNDVYNNDNSTVVYNITQKTSGRSGSKIKGL